MFDLFYIKEDIRRKEFQKSIKFGKRLNSKKIRRNMLERYAFQSLNNYFTIIKINESNRKTIIAKHFIVNLGMKYLKKSM